VGLGGFQLRWPIGPQVFPHFLGRRGPKLGAFFRVPGGLLKRFLLPLWVLIRGPKKLFRDILSGVPNKISPL